MRLSVTDGRATEKVRTRKHGRQVPSTPQAESLFEASVEYIGIDPGWERSLEP